MLSNADFIVFNVLYYYFTTYRTNFGDENGLFGYCGRSRRVSPVFVVLRGRAGGRTALRSSPLPAATRARLMAFSYFFFVPPATQDEGGGGGSGRVRRARSVPAVLCFYFPSERNALAERPAFAPSGGGNNNT